MITKSLPLSYIYSTLPVFADEEVLIMSVCASNNDRNKSHTVDKKSLCHTRTKNGADQISLRSHGDLLITVRCCASIRNSLDMVIFVSLAIVFLANKRCFSRHCIKF